MTHDARKNPTLAIFEIYDSIQGESLYAGYPCTFIRLAGCPLRCRWCDTPYAFGEGERLQLSEILTRVADLGHNLVELTGGEPLAQPETPALMSELLHQGYRVLIETGGSEPIDQVPQGVHIIMDIKCPDSGMAERNHFDNLRLLKPSDEVKFVIASWKDYLYAKNLIMDHGLLDRCQPALSPAFGLTKPATLCEWILKDQLPVRLNLQLHKFIWHPRAKGV